jgi:hypothetical protein
MKKLVVILFCLFAFASTAYSQCGVKNPAFGDTRKKADALFVETFGPPNKLTEGQTIWENKTKGGNPMATSAIYVKRKFVGFIVGTAMKATADNTLLLMDLFEEAEKIVKENGFKFIKDGKKTDEGTEFVFREYVCESDSDVKATLTIGKNKKKSMFSFDHITFYEGEMK